MDRNGVSASPKRGVLVLSDGKPGHYNQSLGIMDRMRDVPMATIEVRFRRKWRDDTVRVLARLLAGVELPQKLIGSILKWALEGSAAATILGTERSDVILSTGSSVAAPNLLIGRLTGAKTAVCTRPSPVGTSHFDLAILPEHMKPRRHADNAVMTLGVPNRVTPESVEAAGNELAERLDIAGHPVIGLLLGGDDQHYSIPPALVSALSDVLLSICEETDARLALTTSRRTDPGSEDVIRSRILGDPSCCLLVLASEPQQKNPVPGILGISDVTIVTEDSVSMVCEAASSGRKIVLMEVNRRKQGHPKRRKVFQLLIDRGYVRTADISNLRDVVLGFMSDTVRPEVLDDARTAADALRDLINTC